MVLTATPVAAVDSGTVPATVSVVAPCIEVTGSFDFGTSVFSQPSDPVVVHDDEAAQIENCSQAEQTYFARVSSFTSATGAEWMPVIDASCEVNIYEFWLYVPLQVRQVDDEDRLLVRSSDTVVPILRATLGMPCAGSGGAGETMNMTMTITASL